jgi:hypothetical protein
MDAVNITRHWTAESTANFTHRIASDFLAQLEIKLEKGDISRTELAKRLDRTPSRVSQLFSASNMNLDSAVKLARAMDMKVALIAYDDEDPENNNGPINSEIFRACWKHLGSPANFFELSAITCPMQGSVIYQTTASTVGPADTMRVTQFTLSQTAMTRERIC